MHSYVVKFSSSVLLDFWHLPVFLLIILDIEKLQVLFFNFTVNKSERWKNCIINKPSLNSHSQAEVKEVKFGFFLWEFKSLSQFFS